MGRKALLIAMLVSVFGCKAMTELKPGRCETSNDCRNGQRCADNNFCVDPDSGVPDTLSSQPDTPVAPPDASTINDTEAKDASGTADGTMGDLPTVDAPVADATLACKTAADCTGTRSHCVENLCVECESGEDCKDPGKAFCASGSCVGCEKAGANACAGKVCAPAGTPDAGGQCVECMTSVNCKSAATPVCERNECVGCTSGEQCKAKNKETPACLSSTGTCVGCLTNADCPSGIPECDTSSHTCVGCTSSLGCYSGTPICSGGVCGKCTVSRQCKDRDPGTPICDGGACVECSSSSDCKDPSKTNCDPVTKTCMGCLTHQNCTGATPICDNSVCKSCTTATKTCQDRDPKVPACAAGGSCVECTERDASACTGKKAMCNTKTSLCVQCLGNNDCGDTTPICSNNTCVACGSPAECKAKDAANPACVTSGAQAGKCVPCTDNSTCGGQVCKAETNACVQCLADKDCTDPTKPICDAGTNICSKCANGDQCKSKNPAAPLCLTSGTCVQCQGNGDCSGTTPICETNACRKCKADDECIGGPGVCMTDGHCATDAETIAVASGTSFPDVTGLSGKKLVVVHGSVSGSVNWNLTGRSDQIVIVGKNSGTISAGFAAGAIPVHVSGGDVFIRNLTITGSSSQGLKADTGGVLRLDRVRVENNRGAGILIDGVRFEITNTTVTGNGVDSGAGIRFQNLSTLATGPKSLTFSTVTGNRDLGVSCASVADTPSPTTGILLSNNTSGDIATCNFSNCSSASKTCGAQP